ncbi:MAG: hypothetical protein IKW58_01000 [Alphaproteobacteria bacterium]|nr:hypothetical protein [Alphaproteobacteria bacterium]
MNLKNYWDFFSKKNCKNVIRVEFFQNFNFALCYAEYIEIYSAECELLQTLYHSDASFGYEILANGMIVKLDISAITVFAKDGVELDSPYIIKCATTLKPNISGSLILTRTINNVSDEVFIYRVFRDKQPQIINNLGDICYPKSINASLDSEIYVIDTSSGKKCIFKENEDVTSKINYPNCDMLGIDMLPSGSFIARYLHHCCLFDKDINLLATAHRTYGITIRGANFIGFEEKLLLNFKGDIIGEEEPSVENITCDGTLLFSHKIVNKYGVGHYLGGKLMNAAASNFRLGTKLAIIYSQGMIFPLSFVDCQKVDAAGDGLYFKRLREMLTH